MELGNDVSTFRRTYKTVFAVFRLIFQGIFNGIIKTFLFWKHVKPEGKAVFITGCDSGFGNATARKLDAKGFHVFAACLFPLGPGAAQLNQETSERLKIVGLDVTSEESVLKALEFVKNNLGHCIIWAIINNAGVYKGLSVEFSTLQEFRDCVEVNAFGPIRVTKAFLPLIRKSKGRVVNVTSMGGRVAAPNMTPLHSE
ncbi:hypothetical protein CEXT_282921 [Caerostris extrusa]|uniref:Estradiol 17-beta-dehydrogenase 2 n=1 Tax=Caerostris extrusa TaxID=172846 RepID=A0AAV4W314_CAEEX|nr:hypothetical protein CEXT_282921 [Caerostris extrusa]